MKTVLQLATEFREASTLLAEYLMENGYSTCYVCGTYYGDDEDYMQSHAWLLTDEEKLIVDITGDQFRKNPHFLYFDKSVFVGYQHELYDLFEYDSRRDIGQHHRGHILTTEERRKYYNTIISYIR